MIASIGMCKDEIDIIESHVRHTATQVDFLLMADNGSTDGTRDLLADLARELPLTVVDDPEIGFYQARKTTALAQMASERGATWVLPADADADEIWFSPHGRIADVLATLEPDIGVAIAALWDHVPTGLDPVLCPVRAMGWRWVDRAPLHKVACRANPQLRISQGNHTAHHGGQWPTPIEGQLEIRHFPYRSAEQFVRKARNGAAAYAATTLSEDLGGHWRGYGRILAEQGEQALIDNVYRRWFWRADPTVDAWVDGERLPTLMFDPVS